MNCHGYGTGSSFLFSMCWVFCYRNKIGFCISPHFKCYCVQLSPWSQNKHFVLLQVAERALFLWNNDHIVSLVAQNRHVVLPLIFSALERNTRSHWNQAVHGLTLNVRKMFLEMDQDLFQECQRKFQDDEAKAKGLDERREEVWKRLEAAAGTRTIKYGSAVSDNILGNQSGSIYDLMGGERSFDLVGGERALVGS